MKIYFLGLLSATILLVGCNSEDEPCPQYPAKYTLDLMRDDVSLAMYYDNVDGELIEANFDIETFNNNFNIEEDYQEVKDQYFSEIRLLNDTEVEMYWKVEDRDTTLLFPYTLKTAPYYSIDVGNDNQYVVEVAEDCSYIELCAYVVTYVFTDDFDRIAFSDIHYCQGREASFYLKEEYDAFSEYVGIAFIQMKLTYYLD